MKEFKGEKLYVALGASKVRRRLNGYGFGRPESRFWWNLQARLILKLRVARHQESPSHKIA